MKSLCYICILLAASCSVLGIFKRFLENFLGFLLMDCASCLKFLDSDFGCGSLVFGCFRQVFCVLSVVVMFGFGLRLLEFGWHCWGFTQFLCVLGGVSSELRNGFSSKNDIDEKSNSKISSCKYGVLNSLKKVEKLDGKRECVDDSDDERESKYEEDEEFDVLKLRKLVKIERGRANAASLELEKERMAVTTAAEETMAMILRLQNEKSLVEMEAKQYRRLAEEKQLHDQEVIRSLRWIAMKHESERSLLEDELRLLKRKLSLYSKDGVGDQSEEVDKSSSIFRPNFEDDAPEDGLVSSLDMGLSPFFNKSFVAEHPYRTACSRESASAYA